MVCRTIEVSRSGYYRKKTKPDSEEIEIINAVIHCFEANHGNYGRIRIRKSLMKEGMEVSEYRIGKILNKNGLTAKAGRPQSRKKRKPTEEQYIEENLIQDKFSITTPNYLWCSDITELEYSHGKLHVSGIIDVATRRLVGWSIDRNQTQTIVQNAFQMAVGRNPNIPKNAVFHSDRGVQYTAKRTKEMVESSGFRKSMSRPGTPSDNQPIESFWHTLKTELGDLRRYSYDEASRKIVEYIEFYYNSSRLHSGIDYRVPNEFFTVLCVHDT